MSNRTKALAALLLVLTAPPAEARIRVVASITDLASIAAYVGGDRVEATAIARPNADPHRVEVLPSYMVRVSRAQIYLKVGLGLDRWAEPILDGSRNAKLQIVDCSRGVPVLEKPAGRVDASMGDVHPDGNPHYWLDPRIGGTVARTVAEALSRVEPAHAAEFAARAEALAKAADELVARGTSSLAGLPGRDLITYHRSWSYLADAFGWNVVSTIEPIPGIPPTGRHLSELVGVIRERNVGLVLEEPYFSGDAGEFLARETGIRVARAAAVCADSGAGSYLAHFEELLGILGGGRGGARTTPPGR